MKWLRWAAMEDFELPSTNRAGDATVHDDRVMSVGFHRSHTAQAPSDKMKLAHTLLLKCVDGAHSQHTKLCFHHTCRLSVVHPVSLMLSF